MKFGIRRTSISVWDYTNEEPEGTDPGVVGAYREPYDYEGRTFYRWVIDVSALEDLLRLYRDYGEIIITSPYGYEDPHDDLVATLEVYDDYRE